MLRESTTKMCVDVLIAWRCFKMGVFDTISQKKRDFFGKVYRKYHKDKIWLFCSDSVAVFEL